MFGDIFIRLTPIKRTPIYRGSSAYIYIEWFNNEYKHESQNAIIAVISMMINYALGDDYEKAKQKYYRYI